MGKEEFSFTVYCTGIFAERLGITEREAVPFVVQGQYGGRLYCAVF